MRKLAVTELDLERKEHVKRERERESDKEMGVPEEKKKGMLEGDIEVYITRRSL